MLDALDDQRAAFGVIWLPMLPVLCAGLASSALLTPWHDLAGLLADQPTVAGVPRLSPVTTQGGNGFKALKLLP